MRRPKRVLEFLAIASLAWGGACAQQPPSVPAVAHAGAPPAHGKSYRIAGKLTDSVSGQAVAGATMMLLAGEPRQLALTVLTDPDGAFALGPVPAGKYMLVASRRGYMLTAFDQHEMYSSAIVTGDGQDTEHIPFRINPSAMIRGFVTDDAGEPVQQAEVLLVRKANVGGLGQQLVKSIQGVTDDTGLFESWNLLPGTYYLAVKAEPWFAIHPSQAETDKATGQEEREAQAALDVAYPVTYYDGTREEESATPIEIKPGDRVQADVSLHSVPALRMTVHLPVKQSASADQQRYGPGVTITQTVLGQENFGVGAGNRPEHAANAGIVEIDGVAPGHYTMLEGQPPQRLEVNATSSQDVDLSGEIPTFPVEIKARMSDGSKLPEPLEIGIMSDSPQHERQTTMTDAKGIARFGSVAPGRCVIAAESKNAALAVVGVQAGTETAADSRFTVRDRKLTINVVLAQGKTNIEGFAQKQGKGQAGVMVVLVPKNPEASLAQFRRDQSDSDGSFLLQNVPPGDYTVVAIEDGWELEWARSAVIGKYVASGVPVHVAAGAGALMKLSGPVAVQAR